MVNFDEQEDVQSGTWSFAWGRSVQATWYFEGFLGYQGSLMEEMWRCGEDRRVAWSKLKSLCNFRIFSCRPRRYHDRSLTKYFPGLAFKPSSSL